MEKEYKISRSKIDLFLECPRCFYLDVKGLVKRPSGPGFSLNSAVDELLKKEFGLEIIILLYLMSFQITPTIYQIFTNLKIIYQ